MAVSSTAMTVEGQANNPQRRHPRGVARRNNPVLEAAVLDCRACLRVTVAVQNLTSQVQLPTSSQISAYILQVCAHRKARDEHTHKGGKGGDGENRAKPCPANGKTAKERFQLITAAHRLKDM
jgi:hypothetical protein